MMKSILFSSGKKSKSPLKNGNFVLWNENMASSNLMGDHYLILSKQ